MITFVLNLMQLFHDDKENDDDEDDHLCNPKQRNILLELRAQLEKQ